MKNRARQGFSKEQQQTLDRLMTGAIKAWDETLITSIAESGADTQDLLIKAISRKSLPMVKLALQHGADANALAPTSDARRFQPVLHHAHDNFSEEIFKTILAQGVDIDVKSPQGDTVALKAIKSGDFDRMHLYKKLKADLSPYVQNIFFRAIEKKDASVLNWSLAQGADVQGKQRQHDDTLATAMHIACHHFDEGIIDILLKKGLGMNAQNSSGETPLHGLARAPDIKKAEFMLAQGADPLTPNYAGTTPLDEAMKHLTNESSSTGFGGSSSSSYGSSASTLRANAKLLIEMMLTKVKEGRMADFNNTAVSRDIPASKVVTFKKPKEDPPAAP